jgi:hypothetical protein
MVCPHTHVVSGIGRYQSLLRVVRIHIRNLRHLAPCLIINPCRFLGPVAGSDRRHRWMGIFQDRRTSKFACSQPISDGERTAQGLQHIRIRRSSSCSRSKSQYRSAATSTTGRSRVPPQTFGCSAEYFAVRSVSTTPRSSRAVGSRVEAVPAVSCSAQLLCDSGSFASVQFVVSSSSSRLLNGVTDRLRKTILFHLCR